MLILSVPPAMKISPKPALILPTARAIASSPDAQYRLIVIPATSFPRDLAEINLPI